MDQRGEWNTYFQFVSSATQYFKGRGYESFLFLPFRVFCFVFIITLASCRLFIIFFSRYCRCEICSVELQFAFYFDFFLFSASLECWPVGHDPPLAPCLRASPLPRTHPSQEAQETFIIYLFLGKIFSLKLLFDIFNIFPALH